MWLRSYTDYLYRFPAPDVACRDTPIDERFVCEYTHRVTRPVDGYLPVDDRC